MSKPPEMIQIKPYFAFVFYLKKTPAMLKEKPAINNKIFIGKRI